jgi:hypothetical protein
VFCTLSRRPSPVVKKRSSALSLNDRITPRRKPTPYNCQELPYSMHRRYPAFGTHPTCAIRVPCDAAIERKRRAEIARAFRTRMQREACGVRRAACGVRRAACGEETAVKLQGPLCRLRRKNAVAVLETSCLRPATRSNR